MTGIHSIPPAILHLIFSNLRHNVSIGDFSQYATVSKQWQHSLESITFMELSLTPEKLRKLRSIATSRRQSYIKQIRLRVSLEALDRTIHTEDEISDEQGISSVAFTKAMKTLFETLSRWRKQESVEQGIQLHILFDSPGDRSWTPKTSTRAPTTSQLALAVQLNSSRLHLGSLPEVRVVTGLLVTGRGIQLPTLATIISKLHGLQALDIEFHHDTRDDRSVGERIGESSLQKARELLCCSSPICQRD